jgi:hypothetical protein
MNYRFLLLFGAVSVAAAQVIPPVPLAQSVPGAQAPSASPQVIRFEDASNKAGINFTHSFGSQQLGSLL